MSTTPTYDTFVSDFFKEVEHWSNNTLPNIATLMSPDYEGMSLLLATLRRAKAQMQMAEMFLEDELVKVAPGKSWEVPGLGMVEQHTGASRKGWKKEELTGALVHSISTKMPNLMDVATGEQVNLLDLVRNLVEMFTDAATPSWKVTGLRKYGIDPDEYCETTWGRKTIQTPQMPESTLATE